MKNLISILSLAFLPCFVSSSLQALMLLGITNGEKKSELTYSYMLLTEQFVEKNKELGKEILCRLLEWYFSLHLLFENVETVMLWFSMRIFLLFLNLSFQTVIFPVFCLRIMFFCSTFATNILHWRNEAFLEYVGQKLRVKILKNIVYVKYYFMWCSW